ncbi:MAG: hypothetical protein ABI947_00205, partial [Chloroflexota bacterium]
GIALTHRGFEDFDACDFLLVTDLLFRQLYAFFIVESGSRRVVHVGITRHPSQLWVAPPLREATPFGADPNISFATTLRSSAIDQIADGAGIKILKTSMCKRYPRRIFVYFFLS